jgi:hypothetical protein
MNRNILNNFSNLYIHPLLSGRIRGDKLVPPPAQDLLTESDASLLTELDQNILTEGS